MILHAADSFAASDCHDLPELTPPTAGKKARGSATDAAAVVSAGSRYGEQRRLNAPALLLAILVHALVLALLLGFRQHSAQLEEARLVAINLSPPPPPPAQTSSQPKPATPAVSAPRPLISLPQEGAIPVPVEPQPAPPSAEPVKVSIASPAPSSGTPASVIQGGDLGARMVSGKPPRYPFESRRKKEQGTVVLSLILGLNGAVEHISVSRSSGFGRLDDAALDAVRRWRWEPVTRGGQPVKVRGIVEIPFVLQG